MIRERIKLAKGLWLSRG